jgi:hypothetical protein
MYCPNCGANNANEQSFCRACGLNLEKTAESLLEQIPTAESASLLRRERNLEKFGNIAFAGFGLVLLTGVAGLVYTIISEMIFDGKQPWVGLLLAAFIIFAVLALAYVVLKEDIKERKQKTNPYRPHEIPAADKTFKLLEDKPFEPIQSVTEATTNPLFVKLKKTTSSELK